MEPGGELLVIDTMKSGPRVTAGRPEKSRFTAAWAILIPGLACALATSCTAAHAEPGPVRRLGRAAVHLRVQPIRASAVQRRIPRRDQHLPRLPPALVS